MRIARILVLFFFLISVTSVNAIRVEIIDDGISVKPTPNGSYEVPLNSVFGYWAIATFYDIDKPTTIRFGGAMFQGGKWCNEVCYKPTPYEEDGITYRVARSQCDNDLWGWIEPMANASTPIGEDGLPDHSRVTLYPPSARFNVTIPIEVADEIFTEGDAYIEVAEWEDACPFENPLTGEPYTSYKILRRVDFTIKGRVSKHPDILRRKIQVLNIITPQRNVEPNGILNIKLKVRNLDSSNTLAYKFKLRGTVHWNTTTQSDKYLGKAYSTPVQSLIIPALSLSETTVNFPFYSTYFSEGDSVDFVVINADEDATDDPNNIKGTMGRDWVNITAPQPCTWASPDVTISPTSYSAKILPAQFTLQLTFTNKHSAGCPTAYFDINTTSTSPITVSPTKYENIPLSSGASAVFTFTVTIPEGTSEGTYYVDFKVFDRNQITYSTTKRLTIYYSPLPPANFTITKIIYPTPPFYVDRTYKFTICAKNFGTESKKVKIGFAGFVNLTGIENNKVYATYPSWSWSKMCNGYIPTYRDICYVGAYTCIDMINKWVAIKTINPLEEICDDIDYRFASESPANFEAGDKVSLVAAVWDDETGEFYSLRGLIDVITLEEEPLYACPFHLVASHTEARIGDIVTYTAYINNSRSLWNFTVYLGIGKWSAISGQAYPEPQPILMPPCNLECYEDTYGETYVSLIIPSNFTVPITRKLKIPEYFPKGISFDVAVGVYRTKIVDEKTKTLEGKRPVCFVYFKDVTNISTKPSVVEVLSEQARRGVDSSVDVVKRAMGVDKDLAKFIIWGLLITIVSGIISIKSENWKVGLIIALFLLGLGSYIGWMPWIIFYVVIIFAVILFARGLSEVFVGG